MNSSTTCMLTFLDLDLSDRPKIGYLSSSFLSSYYFSLRLIYDRYTFKSLGSGVYGLRETDFEKAIMKITWEAGDADTNATVAGALLGCKLGLSRLPPRSLFSLSSPFSPSRSLFLPRSFFVLERGWGC